MSTGPTSCPPQGVGPTTYPAHAVVEESSPIRARARAIPRLPVPFPSPFFFFSGDQARQRRREMSSSASASRRSWPRYGAVPMTRCPDCPRTAPLKRLVTSTDKNGNIGREFVKCESKPEPRKVRSECSERQFLAFLSKFQVFHRIWDLGFIYAISGTAKMWAF